MTIKLVVKNEKQDAGSAAKTLTLADLLITIGSGNAATVQLADSRIAPEQAVIVNENGHPLFINQAKGTILNGEELDQGIQHELKSGDQLRIGSYDLTVEFENGQSSVISRQSLVEEIEQPVNDEGQRTIDGATSFADILSSLRKEEDQYYFQVNEADGVRRRLLIESDELVLGWNDEENIFTADRELEVDQPQAIARKDWSGVTIYPNSNEAVLLNDALVEVGTRLKNGDKLVFSRRLVNAATQSATIIFCEPAALVELNAILPQELITNALEVTKSGEIRIEPQLTEATANGNNVDVVGYASHGQAVMPQSIYYFGYFTKTEIIIMVVGVILTVILTYILLELS